MNTVAKGFTLIELVIVVAIVGILAAIALPALQDYTVRSKVSEGLSLVSGAKIAVSESYASSVAWPATNAAAGLAAANSITGKYVSSVTVGANGVITVAFQNVGTGFASPGITLTPTDNGGSTIWLCKVNRGATNYKYVPSECRN